VLIVCRKDDTQAGGPEKGKGPVDPLLEGIRIVKSLPSPRPVVVREFLHLVYSWRIILGEIRNARPDIVHVHNFPVTLAFVTAIVCFVKKVPLVYDIHDGWYESISSMEMNPLMRKIYLAVGLFFEKWSLRLCTGIVTVSRALRESIMQRAGHLVGAKPFVVMMNVPFPADAEADAGVPEEDYLLYSGTLFTGYIGLEDLIDVLPELQGKKGLRLLIAGDGPYRAELEKYVARRGAGELVVFLGHVPRQELYRHIRRAKLCVMPFRKNRQLDVAVPNKLFEYMACGKAFVYPDLPGFREVMGTENRGRYIPGSREDLKKTITKLLNDDTMRSITGAANRAILNDITFAHEFSKLWELYGTVAKKQDA
jgi:glycosyltransferase involved in cell wall biosynthesis